VGDGKSIKIMTDNWIPGLTPDRVVALQPLPENATVDFLLDPDTDSWDPELVHSLFEEETAAKILRVPLSRHGGDDFASWPYARFGVYTVRSAYNMAREQQIMIKRRSSGRGLTSDATAESVMWKKLWNIKAPGKMKVTLWRMAHDCLPTGHQLQRRHIPASVSCVFCNRERREWSTHCCFALMPTKSGAA
jgi:hypothetical protein